MKRPYLLSSYYTIFRFCILFLLITTSSDFNKLSAQKKASVRINFNAPVELTKVKLTFDNGLSKKEITPVLRNKYLQVNDFYFSDFAVLTVQYFKDSSMLYNKSFFVSDKPATISFLNKNTDNRNPLNSYKAVNAEDVYLTKGGKILTAKLQKYYDEYIQIAEAMNAGKHNTDSLQRVFTSLGSIINEQELQFVKNNPGDFFSLWFFRETFLPAYFNRPADSLMQIFLTSFSKVTRNSKEGKEINKILTGRLQSKIGKKAPVFNSIDINGNAISLSKYSGKYILLSFWATWCMPCIDEMPILKKIRQDYPDSLIEIISVSYDTDTAAYKAAIEKYKMNWVNILKDDNLINLYGNTPIPALYLIDRAGLILYSRFEKGENTLLEIIENIDKYR